MKLCFLLSFLFAFFSLSINCTASEQAKSQIQESHFTENITYSLLPKKFTIETYHQLISTLTTIYEKTDFTPDICKSYFSDSDLSNMVSVPFVVSPGKDVYFEVFGQMYDPQYHYLSQMDKGSMMYGFHYQDAVSQKNLSNFAMGFGLSFKINEKVNMKTLFSNKEIPGYGQNNMALGLEIDF